MRSQLERRVHWAAQVALWLFLASASLPAVAATTSGSPPEAVLRISITACAVAFLFYVSYHYAALVNALVRRRRVRRACRAPASSRPPQLLPAVAIVMTVRDDFSAAAAATMVRHDYPRYHVYLCDDSEARAIKNRVDVFAATHPGIVTVIRRGHATGAKAGNLNHALRCGAIDEPVLLIADADERLYPTQLRGLVEELVCSDAAFVQASHRSVRGEESSFQRMLAPSVATCWRVYEQLRNRNGVPLFLGHGVVIRTALVEEVGGFSELTTSEDIDFTYRLLFRTGRTYHGRTSEEIFPEEEVPRSMQRYRRRSRRWMRQDFGYLPGAAAQLWRGRHRVTPLEAFDLLTKQLHIPVCGLADAYLLSLAFVFAVGDHAAAQSPATLACVGVLAAIAPVLPVLLLGESTAGERVKAAIGSAWLFNSLIFGGTRALFAERPCSPHVEFVPTGTDDGTATPRGRSVATLALAALAVASEWLLLVAMTLAAVGADVRRRPVRVAVSSGALLALVVGLVQLRWNPEYALALLPLGASRY